MDTDELEVEIETMLEEAISDKTKLEQIINKLHDYRESAHIDGRLMADI